MNAMQTRKLAQSLGIKNAAKYSKVELETRIANAQAQIAAVEARIAEQAKPVKAKKLAPTFAPGSAGKCVDCGRKGDPDSPSDGRLCTPHLAEAEHQNNHDNGHDDIHSINCWICWPELNEASKLAPRGERVGTSRSGMRMTVPVRGAAVEKVSAVQAKLAALGDEVSVNVSFPEGTELTELGITYGPVKIVLAWNSNTGAYAYEATSIQRDANSKPGKVRNVSAALRALGL